jgi:hypothetical protein
MRKKALCAVLSVAMMASMFTACGSDEKSSSSTSTSTSTSTSASTSASTSTSDSASASTDDSSSSAPVVDDTTWDVTDGGKTLNIWCWNDEFQRRVTDHYPGYEADADDTTKGKIGDVTVKWTINTNNDNVYQTKLDEKIVNYKSDAADDRVDIFLVEADYALKYVDTEYTVPIEELGITASDIADQYKYTQQVVTANTGKIKGLSWQGCPGILFYNREAAKKILGEDDAAKVQEKVKDWDAFKEFAKECKDNGYNINATANDSFRVFSNNVSSAWVDANGKVSVDDNIKNWVDLAKYLVDNKYTTTEDLWGDVWNAGFWPDGNGTAGDDNHDVSADPVFSYFGPAWLINFCMAAGSEGSIANQGGWGAVVGPQSFFWGGTWICACNGTDNKELVKDIMLKLTADESILKDIVTKDDDFANNSKVMEEMAKDTSYKSSVLGGINPLQMYCDGVKNINLDKISAYDQGCNEEFQNAMKDYFTGNYASYEEALDAFATALKEKYPALDVSGLQL